MKDPDALMCPQQGHVPLDNKALWLSHQNTLKDFTDVSQTKDVVRLLMRWQHILTDRGEQL